MLRQRLDIDCKNKIIAHDSGAMFAPASDEATIVAAEKALQVEFSSDLKTFLLEANGLVEDYGSEVT